MREAAPVKGHVFNGRIRAQALEHFYGARVTELNGAREHGIRNLALECEHKAAAPGERGRTIGPVAEFGEGCAGAILGWSTR